MPQPKVILIVGEGKVGKSVSSCTFPKPIAFLDWDDDGLVSAYNAKNSAGQHIISIEDQKLIKRVEFRKQQVYSLDLGSPFKKKMAPSHTGEALGLLNKFNTTLMGLQRNEGIDGDKVQYKTVVIDPLTVFFRVWKEAVMFLGQQGTLQIQDYGTMETALFGQFIPSIKALPVDYVIVVDHTDMEKDELSGMVMEFPIGPSKNMGKALIQAFTEVWRQREEGGKYVWRTRRSGLFQAGSRYHLPDPVEANFNAVKTYLENAITN